MIEGSLENREGTQTVPEVRAGIRSARVCPSEVRGGDQTAALHQIQ